MSYMSDGKAMIIHLIVGLTKKTLYKMNMGWSKKWLEENDNPLDFHDEIWSVLSIFLKYLYIDWNTK